MPLIIYAAEELTVLDTLLDWEIQADGTGECSVSHTLWPDESAECGTLTTPARDADAQ